MTDSRRQALATLVTVAAIVASFVVANVLGDALRLASFADVRSAVIAVSVVAALGGAAGAAMARARRSEVSRSAITAALSAALVAFMLLRFPSPWIDLGPFGAGTVTTLALVVLPLAQLAAVFAVRRWIER